ncbi:MAG: hypothetical protein Cons2KO_13460 [Congregibacter sp.]
MHAIGVGQVEKRSMNRYSTVLLVPVFVVSVLWLGILVIVMLGQQLGPATDLGEEPMYACNMEIDGYSISVGLHSTNSWLSEHDKHVSIVAPDGRILTEAVFSNPGGLMTMFFASDEEELVAMDGTQDAITIDKRTQTVRRGFRPADAPRIQTKPSAKSAMLDGQYTCAQSTSSP